MPKGDVPAIEPYEPPRTRRSRTSQPPTPEPRASRSFRERVGAISSTAPEAHLVHVHFQDLGGRPLRISAGEIVEATGAIPSVMPAAHLPSTGHVLVDGKGFKGIIREVRWRYPSNKPPQIVVVVEKISGCA